MPRKGGRKGINATGRTKGDGQFLAIPYSMAHSEAFRSLSGPALKVWIELRTQFNGHNNGQVSLSFQRAADLLGMSKSTVGRAFKELEEKLNAEYFLVGSLFSVLWAVAVTFAWRAYDARWGLDLAAGLPGL